jgi:hypothetical protein
LRLVITATGFVVALALNLVGTHIALLLESGRARQIRTRCAIARLSKLMRLYAVGSC